jgi:hypothetical protein
MSHISPLVGLGALRRRPLGAPAFEKLNNMQNGALRTTLPSPEDIFKVPSCEINDIFYRENLKNPVLEKSIERRSSVI